MTTIEGACLLLTKEEAKALRALLAHADMYLDHMATAAPDKAERQHVAFDSIFDKLKWAMKQGGVW